jgi:indole-3-glycerol phosphate synthase
MDILEQIASAKREEVRLSKLKIPTDRLERSELFGRRMPSFHKALEEPGPSIISEFKRKSPSRGDINPSADIRNVAQGYQNAGAKAMSVLTDEKFFGGTNSDLTDSARLINIPILRKDFIVDEYQVVEAKSIGASAVLLIASMLEREEVEIFSKLAFSLGMDVLFEIHDLADLEKMSGNINIIGVNNRNLKTFEVTRESSNDLLRHLPVNSLKVAESGILTPEDVRQLFDSGYDAFLIGEAFMKAIDPGLAAKTFIEKLKSGLK